MKIIKYALILGSLFVSNIAVAQQATTPSTAVLPTAPNPPAIVTTSPNEVEAAAVATTNKVYINQNGGSVNINIQQTGTADVIGTLADPIYLRGDHQTVTVVQTGNSNSLLMGAISNTGTGSGLTITVQQIGDNNNIDLRCGTYTGDATCNGLNLNDKFTGNNNTLATHIAANKVTQTLDMNGDNNSLTISVTAPNSSQNLYFTGSSNTINVTQAGDAGTYGHSLWANFTGSNNTLTTQQYGASETVVNIQSTGSNGVYNIKTGH